MKRERKHKVRKEYNKSLQTYRTMSDNKHQYLIAEKLAEQKNKLFDDNLETQWVIFKGII